VNNDSTEMGIVRRTINPTGGRCEVGPALNVWVFGGSTVYGLGVPDWATLPSYLSERLNADLPECIKVTNLGVQGYVVNQEMLLLIDELKAGHRPNLAVFYDGLNDGLVGTVSPGFPTAHMEFDQIRARVEDRMGVKLSFLNHTYTMKTVKAVLRRLRGPERASLPPGEMAARAKATLGNYEATLAVIRALAAIYHFDVDFFWQPCLFYGNKPLDPFERWVIEFTNRESVALWQQGLNAVYQEAEVRSAASGSFIFLGNMFDSVNKPLYIGDALHLGPRGNQIVAETIARELEAPLGACTKGTSESRGQRH